MARSPVVVSNVAVVRKDGTNDDVIDWGRATLVYEDEDGQKILMHHEDKAAMYIPRGAWMTCPIKDLVVDDQTTTWPAEMPEPIAPLRPYQVRPVDKMVKKGGGILEAPTGAGKTVMGLHLAARQKQRTLILVHTKDLLSQWQESARKILGIEVGIIGDGVWEEDGFPIVVAMIQTLMRYEHFPEEWLDQWGMVLLDECLPSGTLISTPTGLVAIDQLAVGSKVWGYDDAGNAVVTDVRHVFQNDAPDAFIEINGVKMTHNHPVWTSRGYIRADEITISDKVKVLTNENDTPPDLQEVPAVIRPLQQEKENLLPSVPQCPDQRDVQAQVSRQAVRGEVPGGSINGHNGAQPDLRTMSFYIYTHRQAHKDVQQGVHSPAEIGEPSSTAPERILSGRTVVLSLLGEESASRKSSPREVSCDTKGEGVSEPSWRQRCAPAGSTDSPSPTALSGDRGKRSPWGWREAASLLGRCWNRATTLGNRDRRSIAQGESSPAAGSTQRYTIEHSRLDSATLLEQPAGRGTGSGGDRDQVYNIETGTGNYIAGGLLVHNCHRAPASSFARVMGAMSTRLRYGVTATPTRRDGKHPLMHAIIGPLSARVKEDVLVDEGNLIRPSVTMVATELHSVSGNKMTRARNQYQRQALYQRTIVDLAEDNARTHLIARHVGKHADGHQLVLSDRIQHLYDIEKAIYDVNPSLRTFVVTGKHKTRDREEAIQAMRDGGLDVLLATQLADEGLDLPILDTLHLTFPSRAVQKLQQKVGRIMRSAEGKRHCMVYDYVDVNVPVLRGQAKDRLEFYRGRGCVIYGEEAVGMRPLRGRIAEARRMAE